MADTLAAIGYIFIIAGIHLWLGLPAALILVGVGLIYTAVRLDHTRGGDYEPVNTPQE